MDSFKIVHNMLTKGGKEKAFYANKIQYLQLWSTLPLFSYDRNSPVCEVAKGMAFLYWRRVIQLYSSAKEIVPTFIFIISDLQALYFFVVANFQL